MGRDGGGCSGRIGRRWLPGGCPRGVADPPRHRRPPFPAAPPHVPPSPQAPTAPSNHTTPAGSRRRVGGAGEGGKGQRSLLGRTHWEGRGYGGRGRADTMAAARRLADAQGHARRGRVDIFSKHTPPILFLIKHSKRSW